MTEGVNAGTKIVDYDYSMEEAIREAQRCLNCGKPLCRTGCPIENEIPKFIQAIAHGNFGEASTIIAERSNLPAVCGRVCPREKQCEGACILNRRNTPINIGRLERFAADFECTMGLNRTKPIIKKVGRVAVIGSGPAGLTVAGDLSKMGYDVTVFEQKSEPGGILLFGIPDFRLSKDVVRREVQRLRDLGVQFECNVTIGQTRTVSTLLKEGYDAVFIGIGTNEAKELPLENDQLPGIVQATSLLSIVQLVHNGTLDESFIPIKKGEKIVVIGAGNVAIDAARTCLRLGAENVTIVYRRGEANMSCLPSEYEEAKEEGVNFKFYAAPKAVLGENAISGLQYEKQEILEDGTMVATGEYGTIEADKIIIAVGHKPSPLLVEDGNDIQVDKDGYVITKDSPYGMTSRKGVFAAGDVVHKPATVVLAMGEAKKVAEGIIQYCEAKRLLEE